MASVNFLKCKAGKGSAIALMRHCDKDERLKHEHSNSDINKAETVNNIQTVNYSDAYYKLNNRLIELDNTTNTNRRRDRVECFALEAAAPVGMPLQDFMDVMLGAIAEQYGEQNIIAAYGHVDEVHEYMDHGEVKLSREHVHVFVVPEIDGKLNGKQFSSRANMVKLNDRIHNVCLNKGFQFKTGEQPRHQTVEWLKVQSLREEAERLRPEILSSQQVRDSFQVKKPLLGKEYYYISGTQDEMANLLATAGRVDDLDAREAALTLKAAEIDRMHDYADYLILQAKERAQLIIEQAKQFDSNQARLYRDEAEKLRREVESAKRFFDEHPELKAELERSDQRNQRRRMRDFDDLEPVR